MLVWCIILTSCFALLVQYLGTVFNSYWIIYHLLVYYNLLYGYSNIDGKQLYMGKSVNDCATWWVNCFRQEIPSQSCISWVSNSWRSTEMFHFCINLKPMKAFVSTWNQWKPLYQSGTSESLCINLEPMKTFVSYIMTFKMLVLYSLKKFQKTLWFVQNETFALSV